MSLSASFQVGRLRCHCLDGGIVRLDGGAMFGVVPKTLWDRMLPADEDNRVTLAMRCLLVEHDAGPVLIDTAVGSKYDRRFMRIYGVENKGASGSSLLEDSLNNAGFSPEDVRYVFNTHLHFDHAGGNTCVRQSGREAEGQLVEVQLAFSNATYMVQRGELESARSPNERNAASYLPENFEPIALADRWRLLDGEVEALPGITVLPTPGHTPHHQSVLVSDSGESALYFGDLVPTSAHLPLPWVMGYDLEPLKTLETKRRILAMAESERWTVVFEHDPNVALGRVSKGAKSYRCSPLDTC